jgi:hypothetical protein
MSSIFPPTTPPYQHKSSSDPVSQSRNVIMESRSRFFGHFDTIDTSDDCETLKTSGPTAQDTRSSNWREDSGIGMDEAALLHSMGTPTLQAPSIHRESMTKSPKKSRPASARETVTSPTKFSGLVESKAVEEEVIEYKRAEAKVIQGWREKFSNTAQPGRTPGLKRAFQNCGRIQLNTKAKPIIPATASSEAQPSTRTGTSAGVCTTSANTVESVVRTMDTQLKAAGPQPVGRRTPDLTPVHKVTTVNATVRSEDRTRRNSDSSSFSPSSVPSPTATNGLQSTVNNEEEEEEEKEEEDVLPKLCLDRFRFTASRSLSTPVSVQH